MVGDSYIDVRDTIPSRLSDEVFQPLDLHRLRPKTQITQEYCTVGMPRCDTKIYVCLSLEKAVCVCVCACVRVCDTRKTASLISINSVHSSTV